MHTIVVTGLLSAMTLFNAQMALVFNQEESVDSKHLEPVTFETYVRDYFEEYPVLAEIAKCESGFTHYLRNGSVLRGRANSLDIGVMQINERYHNERAKALGMNIYNFEGNLSYAKHLYEKEGVKPWSASSKCWQASESVIAKK